MSRLKRKYTEQEIIKGCIANDRRYQQALYTEHFDVMLAMVRRFSRDDEVCLDILNAGFLKVFRKIDKYSGTGSFQGWIRRIVYHSISDHFKKESKYLRFIVLDDAEKKTNETPLDNLYYEDIISMVESLPEKSRRVFTLYAIDGYAHKESADKLMISEGTSKWYLSKAREELKKLISKQSKQQFAG